jgi:hypothetical protein
LAGEAEATDDVAENDKRQRLSDPMPSPATFTSPPTTTSTKVNVDVG